MKIVIAGASGMIGKLVISYLERDHEVVQLSRHAKPGATNVFVWNPPRIEDWAAHIDGADAVINLAGSPISVPWTTANRELILRSRVESTTAIRQAIQRAAKPPVRWINASAVGYYGDRVNEELDERSAPGTGFLADTCMHWERALFEEDLPETQRVAIRIGVVLGTEGGAYPILRRLAQWGLGGAVGDGKQWMSWVHVADLAGQIQFLTTRIFSDTLGPKLVFNGVSPNPIQNGDFMKELRKQLRRPWSPPAPEFALKLLGHLGGPDASLMTSSQRVLPLMAHELGFKFRIPYASFAISKLIQCDELEKLGVYD